MGCSSEGTGGFYFLIALQNKTGIAHLGSLTLYLKAKFLIQCEGPCIILKDIQKNRLVRFSITFLNDGSSNASASVGGKNIKVIQFHSMAVMGEKMVVACFFAVRENGGIFLDVYFQLSVNPRHYFSGINLVLIFIKFDQLFGESIKSFKILLPGRLKGKIHVEPQNAV